MEAVESILWPASRVRVEYAGRQTRQNPWRRSIEVTRDHVEFTRALRLECSNQEEYEDWEVVAPPRPTLSCTSWDWTEGGASLEQVLEEHPQAQPYLPNLNETSHDYAPLEDWVRKELGLLEGFKDTGAPDPAPPARAPQMRKTYTITLEDNYDTLVAFDGRVSRNSYLDVERQGHWFVTDYYGYRPVRTVVALVDAQGKPHTVTQARAVWVIEHERIDSWTPLLNRCGNKDCVAPSHHELRGR